LVIHPPFKAEKGHSNEAVFLSCRFSRRFPYLMHQQANLRGDRWNIFTP
jgi:hypothetical protein